MPPNEPSCSNVMPLMRRPAESICPVPVTLVTTASHVPGVLVFANETDSTCAMPWVSYTSTLVLRESWAPTWIILKYFGRSNWCVPL